MLETIGAASRERVNRAVVVEKVCLRVSAEARVDEVAEDGLIGRWMGG